MTHEPAWLTAARAKLGTREAPRLANSPTILGWARKLGIKVLGIVCTADSVPWCGLFVATYLSEAGVDLGSMKVGVRASSWATWVLGILPPLLTPGAILVFQRPGGGHVDFCVGEDSTHYHVLGGNQDDCVSIMRLDKTRCIARRSPAAQARSGGRVLLVRNAAPVSVSVSGNDA